MSVSVPGWNEWGIAIDVTDRTASEKVRQKAEERLSNLFMFSSDALCFAELDGKILDVNEAFATLVNYPREQVIDHHMNAADFIPAESRAFYASKIEELLTTGYTAGGEQECVRNAGDRVPVALSLFLIRDGAGTPIHIGMG